MVYLEGLILFKMKIKVEKLDVFIRQIEEG